MAVKRNDPCPCGSGKKYKKCCMQKDNLVELKEVKEERFYQQKEALVGKLDEFIYSHLSQSAYLPLESQFKKRTKHIFNESGSGLFRFWLYFFHRYENGLRGIEWFVSEMKNRLKPEEKEMAERWETLKPQLVQIVDKTESHVTMEDYFTKQTFKMPNTKEHFPEALPWMGTIALLEPIGDVFYFNGMRNLHSPKEYEKQIEFVEKVAQEQQLGYQQVMMDYYPEILIAAYENADGDRKEEKEITLYRHEFVLTDPMRAENFLYNDADFEIKEWTAAKKHLDWVAKEQIFTDSELDKGIRMQSLHAVLEIHGNRLFLESWSLEPVRLFSKKIAGRVRDAFKYMNEHKETHTIPASVEIEQTAVEMGEDTPAYFSIYASSQMRTDIDAPIPAYHHQSLRQLMKNGETHVVENHLRNAEFNVNRSVLESYGSVDVTPDFNTERKELGLPLSPFVTGGEERHTSVKSVSKTKERKTVLLKEDIPMYENLGFSPETVGAFYANDIISFYQEKTEGKSKSTERKYRNSLYDIREILERKHIQSWEEADSDFWESLLTKDIYELFGGPGNVSNTQYKELVTTVKAFIKDLSKKGKMRYANDNLQAVWKGEEKRKEYERTVQTLDLLQRVKNNL